MFQIDNSTAVAAIPASTTQGPTGYFTDGNPATGVPATILPAEFMNMLMMENLNVLTAAGITPAKNQFNQLALAIAKIVQNGAAGSASEAAAGILKLSTSSLVIAGIDDSTAVTPLKLAKKLASYLTQATENIFGWAKVATQATTNAGTDDATIVTPKKLATWFAANVSQATELLAGLAKIATTGQVTAGTDDATIVTPLKLSQRIAATAPVAASELISGVIRLASQTQANAGSDDATAVTPKKLRAAANTCTAWVSWNGTGTVAVRDSYNVSSITDNGVGDFTVNFATPMVSSTYSFSYTVGGGSVISIATGAATAPTVSALRVTSVNAAGIGTGANFQMADFPINNVQVFGGK